MKKRFVKSLFFLVIILHCLFLFYASSFAETPETIIVDNARSHGTYIYDKELNVLGFLLNGCPIDQSIIAAVDLDTFIPDAIKHPYIVNIHNTAVYDPLIHPDYIGDYEVTDYSYLIEHHLYWGQGVVIPQKYNSKTEIYDQFPPQSSSLNTIAALNTRAGVHILGYCDAWYYVKHGTQLGYIAEKDVFVNPSLGKIGVKYTKHLESYRIVAEKCDPDGNEPVKMHEAMEIARHFFDKSRSFLPSDGLPDSGKSTYIGMFDTGYQKEWEFLFEIDEKQYRILIDSSTGMEIYIEEYPLDNFG